MDHPIEERPRRQDDRFSLYEGPVQGPDAPGRPLGHDHFGDDALEDRQIGHPLQPVFHGQAVGRLVALRPGGLDSPAPAPVEKPELNACFVRQDPHQAAEGVDLPDKVPLGQAADGRIAGHLGDRLEMDGHQAGAEAHGARRRRGFAAGMPGPDDDDVEIVALRHAGCLFPDAEPSEDVVEDLLDPHFAPSARR